MPNNRPESLKTADLLLRSAVLSATGRLLNAY